MFEQQSRPWVPIRNMKGFSNDRDSGICMEFPQDIIVESLKGTASTVDYVDSDD